MSQSGASVALPEADPTWRIAIVSSSFHSEETQALTDAACQTLREAGIPEGHVSRYEAAGSFEIPLIGAAVAEAGKADALIGLGVIVDGETHHAELLARETARGIMDVQLAHGIPFAFEVLYTETIAQARARADGGRSKGTEAARAVLHSLAQLKQL